jgi:hypothetical protein
MSNFREIWQLSVNIGQNWPTFVNTWSVNIWSNSANIDQHFLKRSRTDYHILRILLEFGAVQKCANLVDRKNAAH